MTERKIEKVTAFITRQTKTGHQLLLLDHPYAGIQIPAGTVEPDENPEQAVRRETFEETGLTISSPLEFLGYQETHLPNELAIILPPATIYARPNVTSFDWICIRSGVQVQVMQKTDEFSQITYIEHDQVPEPNFVSMQITGWVQDQFLAKIRKRYFYRLIFEGPTKPQWEVFSDHHHFRLFWASLDQLPDIIPPQDGWLNFLDNASLDRD
jgi:8-oxo-dGTP pyrophosphatase MutT (NUDIX family)